MLLGGAHSAMNRSTLSRMRRLEQNQQASWTLEYPFSHVVLSSERYQYILQLLADVESSYAISEKKNTNRNIEKLRFVVAEYLRNCSPPNPSMEKLSLVTKFVYFSVYLGDCMHEPRARELLLDFWSVFEGKEPTKESPIVQVAVDFMAELEGFLGGPPDWSQGFFHSFRNSLSCYLWTSEHLGENIPHVEDYIRIRVETIFALPYLNLWRLLNRFPPSLAFMHGSAIRGLEDSAAMMMALTNDLCSLERDLECGKQNIVTVVAARGNIDFDTAKNVVRSMHGATIKRHQENDRLLRQSLFGEDNQLLRYLDFMKTCVCGNVMTMRRLPKRYATPPERTGSR